MLVFLHTRENFIRFFCLNKEKLYKCLFLGQPQKLTRTTIRFPSAEHNVSTFCERLIGAIRASAGRGQNVDQIASKCSPEGTCLQKKPLRWSQLSANFIILGQSFRADSCMLTQKGFFLVKHCQRVVKIMSTVPRTLNPKKNIFSLKIYLIKQKATQ